MWFSFCKKLATIHNDAVVGKFSYQFHIVFYENHCFTSRSEFFHYRHNNFNHLWKKSGEWFIKKDGINFSCATTMNHSKHSSDFKKFALAIRKILGKFI